MRLPWNELSQIKVDDLPEKSLESAGVFRELVSKIIGSVPEHNLGWCRRHGVGAGELVFAIELCRLEGVKIRFRWLRPDWESSNCGGSLRSDAVPKTAIHNCLLHDGVILDNSTSQS
jgi:hypothetical protein